MELISNGDRFTIPESMVRDSTFLKNTKVMGIDVDNKALKLVINFYENDNKLICNTYYKEYLDILTYLGLINLTKRYKSVLKYLILEDEVNLIDVNLDIPFFVEILSNMSEGEILTLIERYKLRNHNIAYKIYIHSMNNILRNFEYDVVIKNPRIITIKLRKLITTDTAITLDSLFNVKEIICNDQDKYSITQKHYGSASWGDDGYIVRIAPKNGQINYNINLQESYHYADIILSLKYNFIITK